MTSHSPGSINSAQPNIPKMERVPSVENMRLRSSFPGVSRKESRHFEGGRHQFLKHPRHAIIVCKVRAGTGRRTDGRTDGGNWRSENKQGINRKEQTVLEQ